MERAHRTEVVKARVTKAVKSALQRLAEERGELESVIVREAVGEYIARRKADSPKKSAG